MKQSDMFCYEPGNSVVRLKMPLPIGTVGGLSQFHCTYFLIYARASGTRILSHPGLVPFMQFLSYEQSTMFFVIVYSKRLVTFFVQRNNSVYFYHGLTQRSYFFLNEFDCKQLKVHLQIKRFNLSPISSLYIYSFSRYRKNIKLCFSNIRDQALTKIGGNVKKYIYRASALI